MRCVLGLAEGVVVGCADGYARMADKPAATLLHLGPGLANGLSNLHNARRADTPIVNIVGEHATFHRQYDAPLNSDIEAIARPFSHWLRTSSGSEAVARDAAEAVAAARATPGQIATLILPADAAWSPAGRAAQAAPAAKPAQVGENTIANAARILRSGEPTALLLTGQALRTGALNAAGRIAEVTGARLLSQFFNARTERGAGRVRVDPVPFITDQAIAALAPFRHLILVGSRAPVAFFAHPSKPSVLTGPDCEIHVLSKPDEDALGALEALADAMSARTAARLSALELSDVPRGAITSDSLGAAIGAAIPEGAIVVDESLTSGRNLLKLTAGASPHDWLQNLGGSIGLGLPLATGAAIACPGRRVLCLESDGSGMYSPQALWTQAREGLDVTTLVFSNRGYAVLRNELKNVSGQTGPRALDVLEMDRPPVDWVHLARSMGVEACRAETIEDVHRALTTGLSRPGPYLVEAVF
jgi:acetolactate synthase-1/2/3 large subunit